jgi:hypothetical protein
MVARPTALECAIVHFYIPRVSGAGSSHRVASSTAGAQTETDVRPLTGALGLKQSRMLKQVPLPLLCSRT